MNKQTLGEAHDGIRHLVQWPCHNAIGACQTDRLPSCRALQPVAEQDEVSDGDGDGAGVLGDASARVCMVRMEVPVLAACDWGIVVTKEQSGSSMCVVSPREERRVDGILRKAQSQSAVRYSVEKLSRHCEEAELGDAVEALHFLVERGECASTSVFYLVLKRCMQDRDLGLGRRVHALAVRSGYECSAFLGNHIIRMYAAHGRLEEAVQVFRNCAAPDAHVWAAIILVHARHGEPGEAIRLYRRMRESGVEADSHIFMAVLKACATAGDLVAGKEVHADVAAAAAAHGDVFVGNSLVNMYAKCGSLEDARRVFEELPSRDVVSWNAMIAGYAQQGLGRDALCFYSRMRQEGGTPGSRVTFGCLLQACAREGDLHMGRELHAQVQERGLEGDEFIGTGLVDMYGKCGSLEDARRVFDRLPARNVVTWTAMIAGYSQQGFGHEALALYLCMQNEAVSVADSVTFVCLVQACAATGDLHHGKELHAQIERKGLQSDLLVGNCLVDMYAKCGSVEDARRVFEGMAMKDVVTWTAMIAGYAQQGMGQAALDLYAAMQEQGITPANDVTFVSLLQACASTGALHQGKQLHLQIHRMGLGDDLLVGNSLVDMYAKCGCLDDARKVFDTLPTRDVVTWSALLNGYAEQSDGQRAMQVFKEMCQHGVKPDDTAFSCILVACSHAGLVHEGWQYFKMMQEEYGIVPTDYHYSCMVDLLARSGHLDEAEHLLQTMPFGNDVVGWRSLLSACKPYGDAERGRRCFHRLLQLEPENASAYVLLSNIYADAGMWSDVDEIEGMRKTAGACKKAAKACIEVENKVHEFKVGDDRSDISFTLKSVNKRLKEEGGHVPQTKLVLRAVSEQEKEDALCGHAEKLALAYGLLNTPDGATLIVTKNLRMCDDCHSSTKIMSRLEKREIIVRDAHRVHRFLDGSCSCGDQH